jgi:hypothetical protein
MSRFDSLRIGLRVVCFFSDKQQTSRRRWRASSSVAPWGEARDPARDVRTVGFVFRAEGFAEGRFFVEHNEEMRGRPREECVEEKMLVAEGNSLAEDERRDCNVHWVSDETIGTLNDEVLRGKDWGGSADSLQCEAREGFEEHCHAGGDEEDTDEAKRREVQKRWLKGPVGDSPRNVACDDAGSEDEKCCGSDNGGDAPGAAVGGFRRIGFLPHAH